MHLFTTTDELGVDDEEAREEVALNVFEDVVEDDPDPGGEVTGMVVIAVSIEIPDFRGFATAVAAVETDLGLRALGTGADGRG